MEAGLDDVGIGALFGLYDWRFEVLGLVSHALHLQKHYHVGPHTISFPRLRPACGVDISEQYRVSDEEFKRLIAILRLSVPYTGMILTAREPPALRREVMAFGVSQIDAGSRIELGGYTEAGDTQCVQREQFELGDIRSLDEVMRELVLDGYIPSFCTACYRLGRTGEHFMEFAIPGFIQNMCTPNALSTLMEYVVDYASHDTYAACRRLIQKELDQMPESPRRAGTQRPAPADRRDGRPGSVLLSAVLRHFRIAGRLLPLQPGRLRPVKEATPPGGERRRSSAAGRRRWSRRGRRRPRCVRGRARRCDCTTDAAIRGRG